MIQTKDHFQKITKIFTDENFQFYSHIGGKRSICSESLSLLIYLRKIMARPVRPICLVLNLHNIMSSITGKCIYFEVQSPSIHVARKNIPDAGLGLWFSYVVFPVFLAVFCWYLYLAQDYMRHSLTPNLMVLYCQVHREVSWTFRLSRISPEYWED